jgi:hypothetical protein
MPHGWRSPARSPGSPRACATEPPPIRAAITNAFVDRTAIDWTGLLERVRDPRERASLEMLRRLETLRGVPAASRIPAGRTLPVVLLRLLVALAAMQTVAGLLAVVVLTPSIYIAGPRLIVMIAFGCASLLLASASARDRRVLLLLATFTFAASAFARSLVAVPEGNAFASSLLFRGLCPEAFVPAALWQFAVLFPMVHRFTRFDVWSRRISIAAWVLSGSLFAINLVAGWGLEMPWMRAARRDDPGNLFWHLFAIAALPAFAAIFVRAHRAPPGERRKAVRLGYALAISAAPLLIVGISRLLVPGADQWMLTPGGFGRSAIDAFVVSGLAAMPVLATLAVIVDRSFGLAPVAGLANISRLQRLRPLQRREWLTAALERLRRAGGPRTAAAMLAREFQFGVGATSVRVVTPREYPPDSALPVLLEHSSAPIVLAREAEPYVLLPSRDRAWLDALGAVLAAPLRQRNGSVVAIALLGERRGGGDYDRTDRWYIATLLSAAAAAWETQEQEDSEAARECTGCGRVSDDANGCVCGGVLVTASLPRTLSGKFEVQRRLGAGGMGVVYLARDVALGRDVALKTLPRRGDDARMRLRGEARSMAALNHAALATIYGLEFWHDTPVLVVEYLSGGTLADRLARRALTRDETVDLGVRLSDALAYMHERGLLHRDVKPSNIGFTSDGAVKLLDFGLSEADGSAAGTPGYLPPETLAGAPPDTSVDLWGLAVVLLEATGTREASLTAFFQRALAAAPADRFPSAREIQRTLRHMSDAQRARQ